MSERLLARLEAEAFFLTLSRPEAGNCLSAALVEDLHRGLDRFEESSAKVVVFQGEGRHFCTGFDLADLAEQSDADLALRFIRIEQLLARIWAADYPTIAIAHGRSVGAGADLFAACGRRVALEGSTFRFPGADFGVVMGIARLTTRMGSHALEMVEAGREIDAVEARRLGLVHHLTDEDAASDLLSREICHSTRLEAGTLVQLRKALAGDRALVDRDLAVLVRSVVEPGLRARIEAYRDRQLQARTRNVVAQIISRAETSAVKF